MKIYTIATIVIIAIMMTILVGPRLVVATESANESSKSALERARETAKDQTEKIREAAKTKAEKLREAAKDETEKLKERTKTEIGKRLGNSINAKIKVSNKLIKRTTVLLDKLDTKIKTAKTNGKDTASMETLMADSRVKLASATTTLNKIKTASSSADTKEEFTTIKGDFQIIKKTISLIRQNSARVISTLKSYNSATESSKKDDSDDD